MAWPLSASHRAFATTRSLPFLFPDALGQCWRNQDRIAIEGIDFADIDAGLSDLLTSLVKQGELSGVSKIPDLAVILALGIGSHDRLCVFCRGDHFNRQPSSCLRL